MKKQRKLDADLEERALSSKAFLDLIGEGDWTPQDLAAARVAGVTDPTPDQKVNGWSAIWRRVSTPEHGAQLLREATRLGQRGYCLAGLIRATRPDAPRLSAPAPSGADAPPEG